MKNMHKLLFALALAASMMCGAAAEKVVGAEECASATSNATLRVGTYNIRVAGRGQGNAQRMGRAEEGLGDPPREART